jgi:hypothetical protein
MLQGKTWRLDWIIMAIGSGAMTVSAGVATAPLNRLCDSPPSTYVINGRYPTL